MVARKIGENRHGKRASPQTVHRERVRTGFEDRVRASGANHVRQKTLQVERFRSGVGRGARFAHQAMANRAEQADFTARGAKNRVHQIGRRRLAVGPGHANEFQHLGGTPKIICRGDGQRLARIRQLGSTEIRGKRLGTRLLAGNGDGSPRNGIRDKLIPVGFFSADGNKQRARLHFAAVIGEFERFPDRHALLRPVHVRCRAAISQAAWDHAPRRALFFCAALSLCSATLTAFALT